MKDFKQKYMSAWVQAILKKLLVSSFAFTLLPFLFLGAVTKANAVSFVAQNPLWSNVYTYEPCGLINLYKYSCKTDYKGYIQEYSNGQMRVFNEWILAQGAQCIPPDNAGHNYPTNISGASVNLYDTYTHTDDGTGGIWVSYPHCYASIWQGVGWNHIPNGLTIGRYYRSELVIAGNQNVYSPSMRFLIGTTTRQYPQSTFLNAYNPCGSSWNCTMDFKTSIQEVTNGKLGVAVWWRLNTGNHGSCPQVPDASIDVYDYQFKQNVNGITGYNQPCSYQWTEIGTYFYGPTNLAYYRTYTSHAVIHLKWFNTTTLTEGETWVKLYSPKMIFE